MRVRHLSGLSVGSCYAFLPDGSFQLVQLDPFDPDAPAQERSGAGSVPDASLPDVRRRKKGKSARGGRRGSKSARKSRDAHSGRASSESRT